RARSALRRVPSSDRWRRGGPSEIALLLLLLHARASRVAIDHAPLPLGGLGHEHFGDDVFDRLRVALDRTRQRVAAERAEADLARAHLFAGPEPHSLVVDHQD